LKTPETVTRPSSLEAAWRKQYLHLARVFVNVLGTKRHRLVEIGCGRGQLTIPLAKLANNIQLVLVDRFVDANYSENYIALVRNLRKTGLMERARIVVSDYMKWVNGQDDASYDAVISSEFLPEIDSDDTRKFIRECYRILVPEGMTVHSFLSPTPRNLRQRLLITADSNPLWTDTPPKEWFSPTPEVVIRELRKSGFHRILKSILRARLIMKANAAESWLKSAEVKATFYEKHKEPLNESGLEVPDWVIVSGVKPK
jgi:cyclopropane fatty-acyl-phospholipid synthase-like methyltransferase